MASRVTEQSPTSPFSLSYWSELEYDLDEDSHAREVELHPCEWPDELWESSNVASRLSSA